METAAEIEATENQVARVFLKMHGGSCSVRAKSKIGFAFARLAMLGEVHVSPSGTDCYIDARDVNFKPRFIKDAKD